jgi:tetratricopeptide (TPR) repeat protein
MAVDLQPGAPALTPDALHRLGAAVGAGDYEKARDIAEAEIARGCVHPALYNARAMWFERQHRDREALIDYQRSKTLAPNNPLLLEAIGLCFMRLFQFQEAIASFDEAIRANPVRLQGYNRKAEALSLSGDFDGALRVYERAVSLDPRNVESLAGVASLAAQKGDMKTAAEFAKRAAALVPAQPTAQAVLAQIDNSEHNFASAEQRIRPLLQNPQITGKGRASLFGVLGDALDGLHRPAEAFEAYTAENTELLRFHSIRFAGATKLSDLCDAMQAHYKSRPIKFDAARHHDPASDAGATGHVFLLGFYRSGTTLIEQALEAHPEIVTLEEREILGEPAERYLTNAAGLSRLDALSDDELDVLRKEYWRSVGQQGASVRGKMFVDKHPLNTLKLPLIARLFPDAKILFALRDPRDVILSCYRRHFQINAAMYELLTLPGAARFYNAVMELAVLVREKAPLKIMDCRYEEVVEDFAGSMRAICEFVGVGYDASMENFSSVVRSDAIRSPSAQQVNRELYREGLAQWRPYAAQLNAVTPLLQRWIDRFGYKAA